MFLYILQKQLSLHTLFKDKVAVPNLRFDYMERIMLNAHFYYILKNNFIMKEDQEISPQEQNIQKCSQILGTSVSEN